MTADPAQISEVRKMLAYEIADPSNTSGTFRITKLAAEVVLTALDQAAEALKPFAAEAGDFDPRDWSDDKVPECAGSAAAFSVGDLRRAATAYATLKPADTKEGGG